MVNSTSRNKTTKKATASSQDRYRQLPSPDLATEQTSCIAAKSKKTCPQEYCQSLSPAPPSAKEQQTSLQGRNRQSPSPPQASAEEQTSRSAAKSKKTRPPVNQQTLHSAIKSKKTAPLVNAKPTVEQLWRSTLPSKRSFNDTKVNVFMFLNH